MEGGARSADCVRTERLKRALTNRGFCLPVPSIVASGRGRGRVSHLSVRRLSGFRDIFPGAPGRFFLERFESSAKTTLSFPGASESRADTARTAHEEQKLKPPHPAPRSFASGPALVGLAVINVVPVPLEADPGTTQAGLGRPRLRFRRFQAGAIQGRPDSPPLAEDDDMIFACYRLFAGGRRRDSSVADSWWVSDSPNGFEPEVRVFQTPYSKEPDFPRVKPMNVGVFPRPERHDFVF